MTTLANPARVREVHQGRAGNGPVVYWMSRDQRVQDNWALLHACDVARPAGVVVVFALVPGFLGATLRQYDFMLRGLQEVERDLALLGIPFVLLMGHPPDEVAGFVREQDARSLVCDFDPLRIKRQWRQEAAQAVDIPVLEVDAHNVIPAWVASDKQEYGARTIRPRIHRNLEEFLTPFPTVPEGRGAVGYQGPDWDQVWKSLEVDETVLPVATPPGSEAGLGVLREFLTERLDRYALQRNDPNAEAVSGLSPYLHFGQVSAQRAALEGAACGRDANVESFLEELVVRRELSDNFCLYNPDYDSLAGVPGWAWETLDAHRGDVRPYVYGLEVLELARTHSALWNAAQNQLLRTGTMHGYMRMFWAKKILEWTKSPEIAVEYAIYLNDRYQLDGRDPNGYVGVLWSIGGVHDRGWKERAVYGKVRYMNENGCRRKFNVPAYVAAWEGERASLLGVSGEL